MLIAQRLRMLAVHIMTSRVTKISQWTLLNRHSPTTYNMRKRTQKNTKKDKNVFSAKTRLVKLK